MSSESWFGRPYTKLAGFGQNEPAPAGTELLDSRISELR